MVSPQLTMKVTQARTGDLRPAVIADRRAQPRAQANGPVTGEKSVTLRFGSRADEGPLALLAALDSSKPLAHPVLLAEVDGQLVAALALSDGAVVADPFHPTLDVIELLRERARQFDPKSRIRRSGRCRFRFLPRAAAWRQA